MRSISLNYDLKADLPLLLSDAKIQDSNSTLIQIFTSSHDKDSVWELAVKLRHLLPHTQIIGCSTAGSLQQNPVHKTDAVINILQFTDAIISTAHTAVRPNGKNRCFDAGELVASHICDEDTKLLFCYASGYRVNGENLARGLVNATPNVTLAGGIASSRDNNTWVFADDRFYDEGIVLAAIAGDIHVDAFQSSDWMMLGTPMEVTETYQNQLVSINNVPAKSVYNQYLGNEVDQTIQNVCSRFPLLTERNGKVFARACNHAGVNDSISLWGNLEFGESIRFGILDPVSAMDDFHNYTRDIQKNGSQALVIFPSIARRMLMASLTKDEVRQLSSLAPTFGCFCNSQFFYQPSQPDYLHYSQTIFSIREGNFTVNVDEPTETLGEFSQDTLQLRAISHLVGSTTREMEENTRLLEELASTDPLTQALNRHKMQLLLEQEYKRAQRYGRPLSLIMFDMDNFKLVNDTYGHQMGDTVLQQTVAIVEETIRDTDYLSRWGGEEFLILCPETELDGTFETAERIRINLENAIFPEGISMTASLGVTSFQSDDTLDRLLHRVDRALYLSKDKGKNKVTRWA